VVGLLVIIRISPNSYRKYAIDFDGDGVADLFNPADAIGSVARLLYK